MKKITILCVLLLSLFVLGCGKTDAPAPKNEHENKPNHIDNNTASDDNDTVSDNGQSGANSGENNRVLYPSFSKRYDKVSFSDPYGEYRKNIDAGNWPEYLPIWEQFCIDRVSNL